MADYSFVKDETGRACGLWLLDPGALDKPGMVETLLVMKNHDYLLGDYLAKRYRVVPNRFDAQGGCFVMFGSVKAPGEKAAPAPPAVRRTIVRQPESAAPPVAAQPAAALQPAIAPSGKSPVLAAGLSLFLFGGAGQIYLGQWKKGVALILATWLLSVVLVGVIIGILGVGDAYGTAVKLRAGEPVGEWEFNINPKVAGLALLLYPLFACGILALAASARPR